MNMGSLCKRLYSSATLVYCTDQLVVIVMKLWRRFVTDQSVCSHLLLLPVTCLAKWAKTVAGTFKSENSLFRGNRWDRNDLCPKTSIFYSWGSTDCVSMKLWQTFNCSVKLSERHHVRKHAWPGFTRRQTDGCENVAADKRNKGPSMLFICINFVMQRAQLFIGSSLFRSIQLETFLSTAAIEVCVGGRARVRYCVSMRVHLHWCVYAFRWITWMT